MAVFKAIGNSARRAWRGEVGFAGLILRWWLLIYVISIFFGFGFMLFIGNPHSIFERIFSAIVALLGVTVVLVYPFFYIISFYRKVRRSNLMTVNQMAVFVLFSIVFFYIHYYFSLFVILGSVGYVDIAFKTNFFH